MNIASRYWFDFISSTIMQFQNESILHHPKVACLGSFMARRRIDLGLLVLQEMVVRAKQTLTSLPFPILISELCRRAGVPRDPASDIESGRLDSEFTGRIPWFASENANSGVEVGTGVEVGKDMYGFRSWTSQEFGKV
ncbi:hypothetical protein MTR67_034460 [Solanum verrucosum]|uniref:Putative plant transposon protein domain-containing protein n=1 Tax=Solanum verrucosum TaxID=315347 RepID=A0AAF0ZKF2_SOLVR|nr:hypothetical protein MTR67_034460 [Solanum verrucosum]